MLRRTMRERSRRRGLRTRRATVHPRPRLALASVGSCTPLRRGRERACRARLRECTHNEIRENVPRSPRVDPRRRRRRPPGPTARGGRAARVEEEDDREDELEHVVAQNIHVSALLRPALLPENRLTWQFSNERLRAF